MTAETGLGPSNPDIIKKLCMVRDGIYYALGMAVVAGVVVWLSNPWFAIVPAIAGCFFLWFFRDPERTVPAIPGAVVSPADGKVTSISSVEWDGRPQTRISIFLSVFDVHVNRSPIAGTITRTEYKRGCYGNALSEKCSLENEQNIVTVEGEGHAVVFKQIAGLLARRIVFTKKIGDSVGRGERVGMIKFGSRVDVFLDPAAQVSVAVGQHVAGGSSVLAQAVPGQGELVGSAQQRTRGGA